MANRLADNAPEQVRQLAWRDFHHQVTAAVPSVATRDYRSRAVEWRDDADGLRAWQDGRTGVPVVDAGMRQLPGSRPACVRIGADGDQSTVTAAANRGQSGGR